MKRFFIIISFLIAIVLPINGCFNQVKNISAETINNIGYSYYKFKDYTEAIDYFDDAIELNPKFILAYHNRAASKIQLKDYEGAIEDSNKVINIDPQDAKAYNNRGYAKYELKDYKGAIEDFNKTKSLDSSFAEKIDPLIEEIIRDKKEK